MIIRTALNSDEIREIRAVLQDFKGELVSALKTELSQPVRTPLNDPLVRTSEIWGRSRTADYISGTLFSHKTLKPNYFGYQMSQFEFENTAASPAVVGYLENYALYDFSYSAFKTLNDRVYIIDYLKRGQINDAPQIPVFEYLLASSSPREAIVTATHPYTSKVSYYNNHLPSDDDLRWQVTSPNGASCKITEIPSMILEKYPNLSLETFEYSRSIFFRWVDGTTYAELVDRELQSTYDLSTYEYYMFAAFEK